jgi:hypothetical protein
LPLGQKKLSQVTNYYLKSFINVSQAPGAHAYNPSYSGGRDQEDCGLKSAQANSWKDPVLKKPNTKKGLVE